MSAPPLGSPTRPLRVAVVGSGPSGFYATAALLRREERRVEVDVYDRLPTPFGLVRGGVAPDHQNIKNVIRVYNKAAANPGFRFLGNVHVGRDVAVDDLRRHYDVCIFAVGNESDRKMNVPGEDLHGVCSATEFVGWYNGHPDFADRTFDLDRTRRVAVVGNGNVAMDVTRILAKRPESLSTTDIADYAVSALQASAVEEILLLGRRGPAQASFTNKEIKEIGALEEAHLVVDPRDLELDELTELWLQGIDSQNVRKNIEYLEEKSHEDEEGDARRRVVCRFLTSPIEFLGGEDGRLAAVRLERNELVADEQGVPRPRGSGEITVEEVQLVLKAVGYRGVAMPGLPFDERRGILPNERGRVIGGSGDHLGGLYVVGWAKRGPTGLIGTNVADAEETVEAVFEDLERGAIDPAPQPTREAVDASLDAKGLDPVTFADWTHLDEVETERGDARGKVRDKVSSVDAMLEIIHSHRS